MSNSSSSFRIKFLLKAKKKISVVSHFLLPSRCAHTRTSVALFSWQLLPLLLWAFLILIHFTVTNTPGLLVNCIFTTLLMLLSLCVWGEASLLRGDSSEKRWNASISAWEFKDPGSGPGFLIWKLRGRVGRAVRFCTGCPLCCLPGWAESHVGDALLRARHISRGSLQKGLVVVGGERAA